MSSHEAIVVTAHLKEPSIITIFICRILTVVVRVTVNTWLASTFITLESLALSITQLTTECASFPKRAFVVPHNMRQIRTPR